MNPCNEGDGRERPPEYDDPLAWPDFNGPLADDDEACPHCDGTGWQDCGVVAIECPECGGDGFFGPVED